MCAGAIGSPQLLMLSGIGPAARCARWASTPVADLPGVGREPARPPCRHGRLRGRRPRCPPAGTTTARYTRRSAARSRATGPDLHLFPILLPLAAPGRQAPDRGLRAGRRRRWPPTAAARVRLASADPDAPPLIDPGFLRDGRDLDRLEAGLAIDRARRGRRGVRPARHHRDRTRPRRPRPRRPAGLHPRDGRQLLPPGRDLPHGHRPGTRSPTRSCASAGSPGCGSPTPP